jgi:hypothetical protein
LLSHHRGTRRLLVVPTWQIDSHASLAEAVEHLTAAAGEHRPSEVRVHHLDGRVRSVATLD